ncbi:MAG TPA: metallopeptidase family protein [Baekduia sp.]|uniref:metallopeptidase family protein n=1 Tax=Baekduia sp. TaxID=2600305 RepID=UPI002D781406|nr:metallopeptidase family protein [Baekduia sp.]HET6506570.1 metallopeptidase family protein [Baekduia sp.]
MSLRRTLFAALIATSIGLTAVVLLEGRFSTIRVFRIVEGLGIVVVAASALLGAMAVVGVKLAGWSEPESEADFDRVVLRAERLARDGTAAEPTEDEFMQLDPYDDRDFEELVRDAMDDLPDLLRAALDRNVAVVISDQGRRHGAYGLYNGDGATRDDYPDKIIIFRDTLRRDFGHDADLLRHQVTVTVRHELAHHIGFDELGVRDLGL